MPILLLLLLSLAPLSAFSPKKEKVSLSIASYSPTFPTLTLTPLSSLALSEFYLKKQKIEFALHSIPPLSSPHKIQLAPSLQVKFQANPVSVFAFTSSPFCRYYRMEKEAFEQQVLEYTTPALALPSPAPPKNSPPSIASSQFLEKREFSRPSFFLDHFTSSAFPKFLYTQLASKISLKEIARSYVPSPSFVGPREGSLSSLLGLSFAHTPLFATTSLPLLTLPKQKRTLTIKVQNEPSLNLVVPEAIFFDVRYPMLALTSFPELEFISEKTKKDTFARSLSSSYPLAVQTKKAATLKKAAPQNEKNQNEKQEKAKLEDIAHNISSPTLHLEMAALPTTQEFDTPIVERMFPLAPSSQLTCKTILFPGPQFEETKSLSVNLSSLPYPSSFIFTPKIAAPIFSYAALEHLFLYPARDYPCYSLPYLVVSPNTVLPCGNSPLPLFADRRPLSSSLYLLGEAQSINRTHRFIQTNLIRLPNLQDLETDSMSEEFKVSVEVVPQMDHQGFLFAINLKADAPQELDSSPHHIYFILDPSGSINEFDAFKKALIQTTAHLDDSVTYNVMLLDSELSLLSENDLYPSKASLNFLKRNLSKIRPSTVVSFSLLEEALDKLSKKASSSSEIYTAVLLSNGQFLKNLRSHRESLQHLIDHSAANLALYTTAITDKPNLPMLELLARLGRGDLIYSPTLSGFPRKFASAVQKLGKPIAYNLRLTKISPTSTVTFHHENRFAPMLYAGKPYTIYGSASKLEDLTFILQGEAYGKWIHCTKKVSLKNASKGPSYLEEELATQKALQHITDFITTSDSTALIEAKKLLAQVGR